MSTDNTVTQDKAAEQGLVKTTLHIPSALWKKVRQDALDSDKSAQQFVIDTLAEKVGVKAA